MSYNYFDNTVLGKVVDLNRYILCSIILTTEVTIILTTGIIVH